MENINTIHIPLKNKNMVGILPAHMPPIVHRKKKLGLSIDNLSYINNLVSDFKNEIPDAELDELMKNLLIFLRQISLTVNGALNELLVSANSSINSVSGNITENVSKIRESATNEILLILGDVKKIISKISAEILETVKQASIIAVSDAQKVAANLIEAGNGAIQMTNNLVDDTLKSVKTTSDTFIKNTSASINSELENYKKSLETKIQDIVNSAKDQINTANENSDSIFIKYKDYVIYSVIIFIFIILIFSTIGVYLKN
jgi:hypothetical protein